MSDFLSQVWPSLTLTPEERAYCAEYAQEGPDAKPGVMRRAYPLRLVRTTFPGEQDQTQTRLITSGRRSRVFALTVSGQIAVWSIQLRTTGGELFFNDLIPVSTLLNMGPAAGTLAAPQTSVAFGPSALLLQVTGDPIPFEPNIIMEGTQELLVDGVANLALGASERTVLNLTFHVWEFPDMPRERRTVAGPSGRVRPGPIAASPNRKGMR